jgi:hypothetical protein
MFVSRFKKQIMCGVVVFFAVGGMIAVAELLLYIKKKL